MNLNATLIVQMISVALRFIARLLERYRDGVA